MELEEAEREFLLERIGAATDYIQKRKADISEANAVAEEHHEKVFHIVASQETVIKMIKERFDKLLLDVSRKCLLHQGGHALTFIDDHLGTLNDIKEKMTTRIVTCEEIRTNMEMVANVEKKLGHQCFVLKYKFSEFQPSNDVESLCGYLKMYTQPGFAIQNKGME